MAEQILPNRIVETAVKTEKRWPKLLRGLIIFVACGLLMASASIYLIHGKLELRFGLRGFEEIPPPLPSLQDIIFSRFMQVFIALAVITLIILLMAFLKGEEWKIFALITLVLHSFLILLIFTAAEFPILLQAQFTPFMIVDAGLENVTFYNATITGLTPEGEVKISSNIINVGYVKAYRGFPNKTIPRWFLLRNETELSKILDQTVTYMNLSAVRWIEHGEEKTVQRLDLSSGLWKRVDYSHGTPRQYIRTVFKPSFAEFLLGILSPISWGAVIVYNIMGFRKLYEASLMYSIITGLIIFVILLLVGVI